MLEERSHECIAGATFQSLSQSPALVPQKAHWESIGVEHHRLQPPGECEWCLPQHKIRIVLQEGLLERRINGGPLQSHTVRPGDLIISPAYSQEWLRRPEQADFLLLYLEPTLLSEIMETSSSARSFEVVGQEGVIQDPLILQIGFALRAEIDAATAHFSLVYAESLAHALATHLLRRFSPGKQEDRPVPGQLSPVRIRPVIEFIRTQLHQPLTLHELASIAGVSPHHFATVFKQTTGVSPHQYILQIRIEHAKILLLKDELPLSEIASHLGFVDQSHFTRAFKHQVGMTPRAFLLQHRKNIP
jgi:AraC family transcriptional regulator